MNDLKLARITKELTSVMAPSTVAEWLDTPNEAFGGLKPIEVVERGQSDRIWRMIHDLQSGMPV